MTINMAMRVEIEATTAIEEKISDALEGEKVSSLLRTFFQEETWKSNVGDLSLSTFDSTNPAHQKGKLVIIKNKVLSGEYTTPSLIIGLKSIVNDAELFDSLIRWLGVGKNGSQIFF